MPVESAVYLNTLVSANPLHTDGLAQADSHIRLIKQVLQATFPNVAGPVTASDVALSSATGLAATVAGHTTTLATLAPLASPTFTGVLSAPSIQQGGFPLMPSGAIVLWSGASTAIPGGWLLCNGSNGTPNLSGVFVMGAGGSTTVGSSGGSITPVGTTSTQAAHTHSGLTGYSGALALSGSTDNAGTHSHGGYTQQHNLTTAEIPGHTHNITLATGNVGSGGGFQGYSGTSPGSFTTDGGNGTGGMGTGNGHVHPITADTGHTHTLTAVTAATHLHAIGADGSHSHTVSVTDGRPPYYALCYIMKT